MKHSDWTPKHAEIKREDDLSAILKRSDEKVKDIFRRHDYRRDRANDSQKEDHVRDGDTPDPK